MFRKGMNVVRVCTRDLQPMGLFPNNLQDTSAEDILRLCSDHVPEGMEFEIKADLPTRDGRLDVWHSGGPIGDYGRNEIAEEIIAFANTLGGVVCLGINETEGHPKGADAPNPLPRVHELARRLRQAVHGVIDPPLPVLEGIGVEIENENGVVVLRVPPSRRRPHRHLVSKEVFVRRSDETVRVSMREIQELTMQAVSEAARVETAIAERRKLSDSRITQWLQARGRGSGIGLHILGLPTIPIDLGRIAGRPRYTNFAPQITANFQGGNSVVCNVPWRAADWRPGLRSINGTGQCPDGNTSYTLLTNGMCELEFTLSTNAQRQGVLISWLAAALGFSLAWIERVRSEANVPAEYACAVQISILNGPIYLAPYGATSFAQSSEVTLPPGLHEFPLISVGTADEFPLVLQRFDEDVWNLAGEDIQRIAPTFSIELRP